MEKVLSYVGDFDELVDGPVTVAFSVDDSEYILTGALRKPGFDTRIVYFLQESPDPRELLTPIDENATIYRGPGKQEMIGIVIVEYAGVRK